MVYWTLGSKLKNVKWNFDQSTNLFIRENWFNLENVVYKMLPSLSRASGLLCSTATTSEVVMSAYIFKIFSMTTMVCSINLLHRCLLATWFSEYASLCWKDSITNLIHAITNGVMIHITGGYFEPGLISSAQRTPGVMHISSTCDTSSIISEILDSYV